MHLKQDVSLIRAAPISSEPSHRESVLFGSAAKTALAAVALIAGGAVLGRALSRSSSRDRSAAGASRRDVRHRRAARLSSTAAAFLSFSATADSALEHYRGLYSNRAMYAAPAISGATLLTSLRSAVAQGGSGPISRGACGGAIVTGFLGSAFHVYNIGKRPGGLSFHNLFYAAPLGAPSSVALAGILGLAGAWIASEAKAPPARRSSIGPTDALVWATVGGLAGTVLEVGLLHFRGAYQNPHMYLPLVLPPLRARRWQSTTPGPRRRAGDSPRRSLAPSP